MPDDHTPHAFMHDAIQEAVRLDPDISANLVTGWVVVSESMGPDGARYIARLSSSNGESELPGWTRNGLLHYALHDFDRDPVEDED